MSVFDPLQLAKDACGVWTNENIPSLITGFSFDTRELQTGDLFLALKTDSRDGHDYLSAAFKKGASGAIVEQVNCNIPLPQLQVANTLNAFQQVASIYRKRFSGLIIGVTGSCGKTTTKDLLSRLLGEDTHATLLNLNNLLGVPITLMGLDSCLHKYGIIEAGINVCGEMKCLASMIRPDLSIITNVYPVHVEGLGPIDNIAKEKAFLAQNTKEDGVVLFPSSCLKFNAFQCLGLKARVLARKDEAIDYPTNQIIRYQINENLDDTISLYIQLTAVPNHQIFVLPILSEGVTINVALAICACLLIGIEEQQIQARLLTWVPSKHRGQIYHYGSQIYYADCYNANPASMLDALAIFQRRFNTSHNHLYILGSMGELGISAADYHYNVGKSLKLRPQDKVLLLGVHARDYESGLKDAGNDFSQIFCLQNKEKAFDYLDDFVGAVFLKGSKPYALWELLPEQVHLKELRKDFAC